MKKIKRRKNSKKNISKILSLFKFLTNINSNNRDFILKYLNDDAVNLISESIHNLLYNKSCKNLIPINKQKYLIKKIKCDKAAYETIARRPCSVNSRRKKIVQVGGGIGVILSTLIPILTSLLIPK